VIPEGSEVLMPLYLLHRDVDEWGAPIDTFNPDRYQKDGPKGKIATVFLSKIGGAM
jgi:cytochrome P450